MKKAARGRLLAWRSGYIRKIVARPRKMKKPPLSVIAVIITLEPIAGSRPKRCRVIGISTPIIAASSRFRVIAAVITTDGAFEQTDHPRGDEGGDQVGGQPGPAVAHRLPDRGEDVFFFTQTGHVEDFAFAFLTDQVDHLVDGQTTDQLAALVHHRRGNQVVTLECLGGVVAVLVRVEGHRVGGHDFQHLLVRIVDQQALDRQHALEHAVVVDHEQFVGMPGQFLQAAQVAQHHFQADVLADGDHLEVHQRADLVLLVGQRRTHSLALLRVEAFHQFMDHVARQFRCQVGEFVGVQVLGRGDDLVVVHVRDQGFPDRVGDFEEDVAVVLGLDQLPDRQAVVQRQRFEDVGDVGGVQFLQLALEFYEILPVDEVFHPVMVLAFLTMGQVFHHLVAMQQLDHLR